MIVTQGISKKFGAVTALDNISLNIDAGETVAFVGANGSGKTTLLRAILGLVRVNGAVLIDGVSVAKSPEIALRSVAYIPQISPPIEATTNEVVKAQAALRKRTEEETWGRAKRLGLAIDSCRNKRFRDLSGGMKQKLLAAMALASETKVLICDEPTANLDGDARLSFIEQLQERPSDSVLIVCSHREEEVQKLVKRVVSMADGRVVFDGPVGQRTRETATQSDSNVAKEPHESPLTNAPTGSLTEWVLS